MPRGLGFFEYLSGLTAPLRVANITGLPQRAGNGGIRARRCRPPPCWWRRSATWEWAWAPSTWRTRRRAREFSQDDEETLVMFASQAALVIANARRYREERRARNDLETLVNTSPVGVAVFDAATGALVSINREARRIVDGLRDPDQATEQLLDVVSFRRADGREVSLSEFPLARALATGETVRAEEIVISVPDGRSVTTLINATPILPRRRAPLRP